MKSVLLALLVVAVCRAQTLPTIHVNSETGGFIELGKAMTTIQDLDGDGVREIVVTRQNDVSVYSPGCPPFVGQSEAGVDSFGTYVGRVMLFSGATGAQVWSAWEPNPSTDCCIASSFGSSAASLGDVNGDGRSDVAVCAPDYFDYASSSWGKTVVLSGIDGSVVWTATDTSSEPDRTVSNAGDVNGDGVADVVNMVPGGLRWRSGATGALLNSVGGLDTVPGPLAGGFDVNGDGIPDAALAVHAYVPGGTVTDAYVYSATGALLTVFPANTPSQYKTLLLAADLNGDGYGDLVTAERYAAPQGTTEVRASSILGAQHYGTSSPGGPSLSWVPIGTQPSFGVVAVTGATPSGTGLLGASAAALAGSPPIWINPQQLILLQPVQFNASGTFVVPLNLRQPSIAGVSAYVQAADGAFPAATTTNALQLLFGN